MSRFAGCRRFAQQSIIWRCRIGARRNRGLRRAAGPHPSRRSLTVVVRLLRPWRGVRATRFPECRRRQPATSMNRSHPNPSVGLPRSVLQKGADFSLAPGISTWNLECRNQICKVHVVTSGKSTQWMQLVHADKDVQRMVRNYQGMGGTPSQNPATGEILTADDDWMQIRDEDELKDSTR